jgi:hypothetical protein
VASGPLQVSAALFHMQPVWYKQSDARALALHGLASQYDPRGGDQVQPGWAAHAVDEDPLAQGVTVPEHAPLAPHRQPVCAAQVVDVELALQACGVPRQ